MIPGSELESMRGMGGDVNRYFKVGEGASSGDSPGSSEKHTEYLPESFPKGQGPGTLSVYSYFRIG